MIIFKQWIYFKNCFNTQDCSVNDHFEILNPCKMFFLVVRIPQSMTILNQSIYVKCCFSTQDCSINANFENVDLRKMLFSYSGLFYQ